MYPDTFSAGNSTGLDLDCKYAGGGYHEKVDLAPTLRFVPRKCQRVQNHP
jgi:hypothetical protein